MLWQLVDRHSSEMVPLTKLRDVPNKLLGISGMILIPVGLASVPWLEASNPFANPLRRGSGTWLFVLGLFSALALGYLSALPLGQTL